MIGFGHFPELVIVLIIALLFPGPKRLLEAATARCAPPTSCSSSNRTWRGRTADMLSSGEVRTRGASSLTCRYWDRVSSHAPLARPVAYGDPHSPPG